MNEEEAKETLKTMKENIDKKYLKTRNSVAIEIVLNLLEKKDRIINEMIDFIDEIDGCLCFDLETRNCIDKNCKDCIKQYFERKVEE